MKKKKTNILIKAISALLGFGCALVLGALFYGAMVYQLGDAPEAGASAATPAPLIPGTSARALFSGPLLALDGMLTNETVRDEVIGDTVCRVVTRTYALSGGRTASAVSAYPSDYLSRLAQEGFTPQLITGFSLAGLDAVCEKTGTRSLLAARDGERVYLLETQADEQTLYALGAGARLEGAQE